MTLTLFKNTIFALALTAFSCGNGQSQQLDTPTADIESPASTSTLLLGADQSDAYLPLLKDKRVGVVANQTAVLSTGDEPHLVDHLVASGISVQAVFAPEHGFRGTADAGELVKDGVDTKTGLPIISLYGKNKKPKPEQIEGLEVIVFDIQDVGARFYTYISTLHYVMEAAAEQGITVMVMDRPNPNGHYIDGPILEPAHSSFVGMHPIPVVHGMTIAEYAQMINGQGWLKDKVQCTLEIVPMEGYTKDLVYSLPIKPSPNLPNDVAINLYPSLCFFEGTPISAGRGTDTQFQVFGAPDLPTEQFPYRFTPGPNEGSKYPKFDGKTCNGMDLTDHHRLDRIDLHWLIEAYVGSGKSEDFFTPFFTKLAGTEQLQKQIEQGYTAGEIRKSWRKDLMAYDQMRKAYLLY